MLNYADYVAPASELSTTVPPAGPELDLLIGSYVMGYLRLRRALPDVQRALPAPRTLMFFGPPWLTIVRRGLPEATLGVAAGWYEHRYSEWKPSTSDSDALPVLDTLCDRLGCGYMLMRQVGLNNTLQGHRLTLHGDAVRVEADGKTRAEAICRAGFLAVQRGLLGPLDQLQAAVSAASLPTFAPATERTP